MMRSVLVAIALAALALPQNALACVYSQRPEEVGHASGQYFAKEMLAAATYADLVLVEDDGTRAMDARPTGIITLRTIARFKGNSADRFTVFGNPLTFSPDKQRIFNAPLQHFTSETGQVTPFSYLEERPTLLFPRATGDPPPPPIGLTSCSPPALMAETGRFYVVLRDAEGRVLNRLTMSNGKTASPNHAAFGYVPVTLSDDDFWLWSVRMAAAAPQEAQELLYLTPGSDPVRVERDLRAAGATIRAAYYARGDFIEEVRPSPHEQTSPWLARAADYLAQSQRGRIGDPHHGAAEFLRQKLSPMQNYGTGLGYEVAQAFTRSVRDVQQATGTPRLIALEVAGDPHALAGQPFVSRIAPLDRELDRLPQVNGTDEADTFATMQRIERDIWLLNGGAGNRQGTLP
ncbi:hypothetical protein GRI55_01590 [Erythrobacter citreus]|uniref:Uncharacterized protein n=1 Tax=Qipengyuania citrea TaxID=225971 RepID=A0A6I4UB99_9SPHN|nr:hypothetical protein [Qipengyuania citrea]MDQ0566098.1 hypothetical protein [Qipengyuania citrea]MXP34459.1 hypothetical protein [Qipengyuania citrea]